VQDPFWTSFGSDLSAHLDPDPYINKPETAQKGSKTGSDSGGWGRNLKIIPLKYPFLDPFLDPLWRPTP